MMSEESVEIVKRLYEGWTRADFSVGADVWHPDLEFTLDIPGGVSDVATVRGVEAMGQLWREQLDAWEEFTVGEIEELIDAGDKVVVLNQLRGRGRYSGVDVSTTDRGAVFTIRDGKVVRLFLTNRANALRDAGLSE